MNPNAARRGPLFRNPTRALCRAILDEAIRLPAARGWSLQGFGMLRCRLPGDMRLHVWAEDLAVPHVTEIHTHPWRFSSFVIAGVVSNLRYETAPDGADALPQDGWEPFVARRIVPGEGLQVLDERHVRLRRIGFERVRAGSWYYQEPDEIHASRPLDGSVTLIQRQRTGPDQALTFYRPGEGWVSAEPRPATDAEVVHACTRAVRRWFSGD